MRRQWTIYPIIVAAYPIVASYQRNAEGVPISQLAWPLGMITAASILALAAVWLAVRDTGRAGLLVMVGFVFFHTAALAPSWVEGTLLFLSTFWVRTRFHIWPPYVAGAELLFVVGLAWIILKKLKEPGAWTPYLNMFAFVLILIPAIDTVRILAREPSPAALPEVALASQAVPGRESAQNPDQLRVEPPGSVEIVRTREDQPDIYYIILDGYARTDVMRDLFSFDNRPLMDRLRKRGFYVADQSTANYCQTPLSLSCSLNSIYLNDRIPSAARDKSQLSRWIGSGAVVQTLRRLGYRFVTFATGFDETEQPGADVYLSPTPFLSPFHRMLIGQTPLVWVVPGEGMRDEYISMRERTLFTLEQVPLIARDDQPTFTFAHILSPHPPFIFGENGEDVSPHDVKFRLTDGDLFGRFYGDHEKYIDGYRKEATFISNQVEMMIDHILANSRRPPVIILQSDHGSGMNLSTNSLEQTDLRERMSILNAYYLPGAGQASLYPSISPVNSFRVVFNTYFDARLELLPDRSYYSTWSDPFLFTDVSRQVRQGPPAGARVAATEMGQCLVDAARSHGPDTAVLGVER